MDIIAVANELADLLPEVKTLYLTGSYATGHQNKFSDLDFYLFVKRYEERHKDLAKSIGAELTKRCGFLVETDILDQSFLAEMPFGHPLFNARRNLLYASKLMYGEKVKVAPLSFKELQKQLVHFSLTHLRLCSRERRRKGLDYTYLKRIFRFHASLACLRNKELFPDAFKILYQGITHDGDLAQRWRQEVPDFISRAHEIFFGGISAEIAFSKKYFLMHRRELLSLISGHEDYIIREREEIIRSLNLSEELKENLVVSPGVRATYKGNLNPMFLELPDGTFQINDTLEFKIFIEKIFEEYT